MNYVNRKDLIVSEQGSIGVPYINTSVAAAAEVTIPANTQIIEVHAKVDDLFLLYGENGVILTPCTEANSKELIDAGTTRHYSVKKNTGKLSIIGKSASTKAYIYFKTA